MAKFDVQYLELCKKILKKGVYCHNRTGVNTYALPHQILQFDLEEEFPILTTKEVAFKSAVLEMLWIYQAQSNDVKWLQDRGVKVWNGWQIKNDGKYYPLDKERNPIPGKEIYIGEEYAGTIGTAYGWIVNRYQLVQQLIDKIKNNPDDRRMIMSLWQDEYLKTAALPSCVWNSQWRVLDGKLNCMVTVRSNDVALGMPFNVTQYAILVNMLAQVTGYKSGIMTYVINDAHIYENQIDGINEQMNNLEDAKEAPNLWINPEITDFFAFDNSQELKDIQLINYKHCGKIKMPISG
jgi:thymidylate synthase